MKKLLFLTMCVAMTGCMMSKPAKKPSADKAATNLAAEAKLAQKLPIVQPETINPQNALTKANDTQAEIERDKKRMAVAPTK